MIRAHIFHNFHWKWQLPLTDRAWQPAECQALILNVSHVTLWPSLRPQTSRTPVLLRGVCGVSGEHFLLSALQYRVSSTATLTSSRSRRRTSLPLVFVRTVISGGESAAAPQTKRGLFPGGHSRYCSQKTNKQKKNIFPTDRKSKGNECKTADKDDCELKDGSEQLVLSCPSDSQITLLPSQNSGDCGALPTGLMTVKSVKRRCNEETRCT